MSPQLRFWGVRGSVPTPGIETVGYGGNTSCVEARCGGSAPVILDAGTGIRELGLALLGEYGTSGASVSVFLTHFHWDHIQGLPFFAPLYESGWEISFHAALPADEIRQVLENQMALPCFSAGHAIRAVCRYAEVGRDGIEVNGFVVRPVPLCHPGGSSGYRLETPETCIVYATDHEHGDEPCDAALVTNAQGADLLIYDAQYTPEEYQQRKGWGHSTWLEATRLARETAAKQLALFHHDPGHDDEVVSRIAIEARAEFKNTIAAREGDSIRL